MAIFVTLYALPEVLIRFVDTTAMLFPCAQQTVGGRTSAVIDSLQALRRSDI